ncbi:hypothetical protein EAF00_000588 [Botryotinia globosa]|nr:hypothetical protein EAF00_000588 [Botryotinia globosa]
MALIFAHGKLEDPEIHLIYTCLHDVKIELKSQSRVHTAVASKTLSASCAHGSGMVSMAIQRTYMYGMSDCKTELKKSPSALAPSIAAYSSSSSIANEEKTSLFREEFPISQEDLFSKLENNLSVQLSLPLVGIGISPPQYSQADIVSPKMIPEVQVVRPIVPCTSLPPSIHPSIHPSNFLSFSALHFSTTLHFKFIFTSLLKEIQFSSRELSIWLTISPSQSTHPLSHLISARTTPARSHARKNTTLSSQDQNSKIQITNAYLS